MLANVESDILLLLQILSNLKKSINKRISVDTLKNKSSVATQLFLGIEKNLTEYLTEQLENSLPEKLIKTARKTNLEIQQIYPIF